MENNSDKGWIVDGKLYIDPGRELFIDLAKTLKDNEYMNDTSDWQDGWFADMKDEGPKKVFGYFGPAWLINYVMAGNSGGSVPGEGTFGDWAVCKPTNGFWRGQVRAYTSGEKTREEALTDFKREVADNLDIIADLPEETKDTDETEDTEEA